MNINNVDINVQNLITENLHFNDICTLRKVCKSLKNTKLCYKILTGPV
jgi:hypothetical protein